jgi:REP element-mobilizing transposase RayT
MMAEKFANKYRIPTTRLKNWDYRRNAAYFVTICTQNRGHYFGNIVNGEMNLSGVGIIADVLWYEIKNHSKIIELDEFVVMPNHIHGILIIHSNTVDDDGSVGNNDGSGGVETLHATSLRSQQSTPVKQPEPPSQPPHIGKNQTMANICPKPGSLSVIVRSYKSAVTKHANRLGFQFAWQSRFHDHIIRNQDEFQRIREYIINNPKNWTNDKFNNQ